MLTIDERLLKPNGEMEAIENFNRVLNLIDQLSQDIDLGTLQADIAELKSDVAQLQSDLASLTQRVEALETPETGG